MPARDRAVKVSDMKKIVHTVIGAALAYLYVGAFADGVPLITAGPPIAANDPVRQHDETRTPEFVKHHSIILNKAAFGADVVTVTIEGKEYRFAGRLAPPPPPLSASQVQLGMKPNEMRTWSGGTGTLGTYEYGTLSMSMSANGDTFAIIDLPPARRFTFGSGVVMTETDRNKTRVGVRYIEQPAPRR